MAPSDRPDEESSSVVVVTPVNGSDSGDSEAKKEKQVTFDAAVTSAEPGKEPTEGAVAVEGQGDAQEDKTIVGMKCERKNLYQKWDMHSRFTWTEKYPDDLEEAAENEETVKYAILVRNKKSYDSRKKLEVDSIVIQSPLLKHVLHSVLKDYPGVTVGLQRLTFSSPFKPFVHRWDALTASLTSDEYDEAMRSHARLLHDVLAEELRDVISSLGDYVANRVVTYEHIWTIFPPESVVCATRYGKPVAVKQADQGNFMEHKRYGPCFFLKCNRVDWDGGKFGYDVSQHVILPFAGTKPIAELECFPLRFHPDAAAVSEMLLARGRLFEQLAGFQYKSYSGVAIEQTQFGPQKVTVEGRIVVDALAHGKFNPTQHQALQSLQKVESVRDVQAKDGEFYEDGSGGGGFSGGDQYDDYNDYTIYEDDFLPSDKPGPLTAEQLVLCTPMLRGYALKTKKWLEFYVDCVSEVVFDETAFDSLVLPGEHKDLVLAFAQSQIRYKDKFDDIITGKGKGIIMLLSGGPGIGKTLTAESVAEVMKVPLYVMSASDLGVSSWDVEMNLSRALEMVAKWNAVLLLDECDVFLETRTADNLDRNKIVSIFLRTLEYYEGILFLTTNRVEHMDPAFSSRIHVSLEYQPLDRAARGAVWRNFLGRAAARASEGSGGGGAKDGGVLSEEEIERLAGLELNGRQIKNVLKTGNLLACHRGEELGYRHLKTVLTVEGHKLE